MPRPRKDIHRVQQMISCYEKDLDFIYAHKGNEESLSAYMIDAAYEHAGSAARYENLREELKEAKKKIQDLEYEKAQLKTIIERLQKKEPAATHQDLWENPLVIQWWENKKHSVEESYKKHLEPGWDSMCLAAIRDYPGIPFNSGKDVKEVTNHFRNNGHLESSTPQGVIS